MKTAIYAGSFDPFTKGHEDVLLQAIDLFDEVIILVCDNNLKYKQHDKHVRASIIELYLRAKNIRNVAVTYDADTVATIDFAKANNAQYLIRGIRSVSDFEYEMQIANMNKLLDKSISTIYFTPSTVNQFTSSSMVREFLRLKKSISVLVPEEIEAIITNNY